AAPRSRHTAMLLRRRRPTLEIHVPISPTASFLNMTHYLVRSLRRNGGRYRDAPIVLTAGAERHDGGLASRHPWLADNGVDLRWVDDERFARYSWWATACERFRHATRADVVLELDADTLIAGPLDELVEQAHDAQAVCGVVAHLPPLPSMEDWRRLYTRSGPGE